MTHNTATRETSYDVLQTYRRLVAFVCLGCFLIWNLGDNLDLQRAMWSAFWAGGTINLPETITLDPYALSQRLGAYCATFLAWSVFAAFVIFVMNWRWMPDKQRHLERITTSKQQREHLLILRRAEMQIQLTQKILEDNLALRQALLSLHDDLTAVRVELVAVRNSKSNLPPAMPPRREPDLFDLKLNRSKKKPLPLKFRRGGKKSDPRF